MTAQTARQEKLDWALALLIPLVLWLVTRRFMGLEHDARLYMAQALRRLNPGPFAGDLYFAFGSQDQLSLFSLLLAPTIDGLGLMPAYWALLLVSLGLWVTGLLYVLGALVQRPLQVTMVAAAVLLLPSTYTALDTLHYAEAFLSPRLPAEAMSLFGFGLLLRGRPWPALPLFVASALLHPLMAVPGTVAVYVDLVRRDRRWLLAIPAGATLLAALAMGGIEPFARLLVRMDTEWVAIVRSHTLYGYLLNWSAADWVIVVPPLLGVRLAWPFASPALRQLFAATLLTSLLGLIVSLVGAELLDNLLLTNLQLWRTLWVTVLLGNVGWGIVVVEVYRGSLSRIIGALVLLGLACLATSHFIPTTLPLALILLIAAAIGRRAEADGHLSPGVRRVLKMTAALAAAAALAIVGNATLSLLGAEEATLPTAQAYGACVAIVGVITLALHGRRFFALSALSVIGVYALLSYDQRGGWEKFITAPPPPELVELLPPGATVYWNGDMRVLWFTLRRASYHSCTQGAGVMFFRGTATEYERRDTVISRLVNTGLESPLCRPATGQPSRPAEVCRALPELDYVVLGEEVTGLPSRRWDVPLPADELQTLPTSYFAYRCADLR